MCFRFHLIYVFLGLNLRCQSGCELVSLRLNNRNKVARFTFAGVPQGAVSRPNKLKCVFNQKGLRACVSECFNINYKRFEFRFRGGVQSTDGELDSNLDVKGIFWNTKRKKVGEWVEVIYISVSVQIQHAIYLANLSKHKYSYLNLDLSMH